MIGDIADTSAANSVFGYRDLRQMECRKVACALFVDGGVSQAMRRYKSLPEY